MNNKILYGLVLFISVFFIIGCNNRNDLETYSKEVIGSMKVIINNDEYVINLEENDTVKSFIDMLPQELNMNDLNNNEKYVYLDKTLPTNSINPKKINRGDVMLYGNDCLVIFYKSFKTSYSYTKIGHIDDLPDLGNDSILVRFEK